MTDMTRWIKQFDQMRTNPESRNTEWESDKYDLSNMTWKEISEIVLDLPDEKNGGYMTFGKACSALKESWKAYRINNREYRSDIAWQINQIQEAMGIPRTEFQDNDEEWGSWEGI